MIDEEFVASNSLVLDESVNGPFEFDREPRLTTPPSRNDTCFYPSSFYSDNVTSQYSRRLFLCSAAAIGSSLTGGCTLFDRHNPGLIIIENNHERAHDVTLAIPDGPEKTVNIKSGGESEIEKFITDPGTYNIHIYIDSTLRDTVDEYKLQKDSNGNITGGEIHITITNIKEINWEISYSN